jgi:hypothetical protein
MSVENRVGDDRYVTSLIIGSKLIGHDGRLVHQPSTSPSFDNTELGLDQIR